MKLVRDDDMMMTDGDGGMKVFFLVVKRWLREGGALIMMRVDNEVLRIDGGAEKIVMWRRHEVLSETRWWAKDNGKIVMVKRWC